MDLHGRIDHGCDGWVLNLNGSYGASALVRLSHDRTLVIEPWLNQSVGRTKVASLLYNF